TDLRQGRRRSNRSEYLSLGDADIAVVTCVTRLVANRDVRAEIVLLAQRDDIVPGAQVISVAEAVIVVARDRRGLVEKPGNSVIGNFVGLLIQVAERHASTGSQAKRQGGRDSVAAVFRHIAASHTSLCAHQVEAEAGAFAEGFDWDV